MVDWFVNNKSDSKEKSKWKFRKWRKEDDPASPKGSLPRAQGGWALYFCCHLLVSSDDCCIFPICWFSTIHKNYQLIDAKEPMILWEYFFVLLSSLLQRISILICWKEEELKWFEKFLFYRFNNMLDIQSKWELEINQVRCYEKCTNTGFTSYNFII